MYIVIIIITILVIIIIFIIIIIIIIITRPRLAFGWLGLVDRREGRVLMGKLLTPFTSIVPSLQQNGTNYADIAGAQEPRASAGSGGGGDGRQVG